MSHSVPIRVLPTETYFAMVREKLDSTGQAFVRVTGISMMPLLRHMRDGVILEPPGTIRPGDIVLFDRRSGRYALHRVIRVHGDTFDMAGDNQWHVEYGLPLDQVMGVAVSIVRDGRVIPCSKLFQKIYARALTCLTEPRINMRKAVGRMVKSFRRAKTEHRRENRG